jgi:hypothetical protein
VGYVTDTGESAVVNVKDWIEGAGLYGDSYSSEDWQIVRALGYDGAEDMEAAK